MRLLLDSGMTPPLEPSCRWTVTLRSRASHTDMPGSSSCVRGSQDAGVQFLSYRNPSTEYILLLWNLRVWPLSSTLRKPCHFVRGLWRTCERVQDCATTSMRVICLTLSGRRGTVVCSTSSKPLCLHWDGFLGRWCLSVLVDRHARIEVLLE